MKTHISHSLEETQKIAAEWLESFSEVRPRGPTSEKFTEATVVGLSGHLGAGKTAFVKAIARTMGVKEVVTSPTFVIMKIYSTTHVRWPRLVHIDAYRLEKPEELQAIGFEKSVADPHNLIMVEWPENVGLGKLVKIQELKFEIVEGTYRVEILDRL